jgi:mRNA interferase MazF
MLKHLIVCFKEVSIIKWTMSCTEFSEKPPVYPVKIAHARIKQIYWCEFHHISCVHSPEMWKKRPVIIVSRNNEQRGLVTVVPCSTDPRNDSNKWSVAIKNPLDNRKVWVVCNAITSISISRLSLPMGGKPLSVEQVEFDMIVDKILRVLPIKKP